MGWRGEINLGRLCRAAYDRDIVLIGMSTYCGHPAGSGIGASNQPALLSTHGQLQPHDDKIKAF